MPALLLPAALVALIALVIPLALHLARHSEARPTDFAALEWLREKPRPKSRLRFDEWPLLALRLLLITGIALWLARPVLPGSADLTPVVAAVPSVDHPQWGRHIELGVKGEPDPADAAYTSLREGLKVFKLDYGPELVRQA